METIVGREVSGNDIDRATIRAVVQVEARKLHHARIATVEADVALLNCLIIDLEIDLNVILWRVAEVTDVDHEIVEILLPEHDTARLDIRDRDICRGTVPADVQRRKLRVV